MVVSGEKKKIGSTGGMQRSVETSKIMQQRAVITKERIDEIKWAYQSKNFSVLAETTMKDEITTFVGLILESKIWTYFSEN